VAGAIVATGGPCQPSPRSAAAPPCIPTVSATAGAIAPASSALRRVVLPSRPSLRLLAARSFAAIAPSSPGALASRRPREHALLPQYNPRGGPTITAPHRGGRLSARLAGQGRRRGGEFLPPAARGRASG